MPKVSKSRDKQCADAWRIRWSINRKRKCVFWKGTEAEAETAARHIQHLIESEHEGYPFEAITKRWLSELSDDEYAKLVGIGGVETREEIIAKVVTIQNLDDSFLVANRSKKETTQDKYKQAWNVLDKHFGSGRDITTITRAEARAFREWLELEGNLREGKRKPKKGDPKPRTTLDVNTVRRRIGIPAHFQARYRRQDVDGQSVSGHRRHGLREP